VADAAPVAIYGATGHTGRLVAAELERLGARCVVAGRDASRLTELARQHPHVVGERVARVEDPSALREMLDGCGVLVNCAGPLSALGEPVVRAAIETGTHYVDPAGEQAFIRAVFERHGAEAKRRGVTLVPALGFDYAPGDCIARLAADGREPLRDIVVAYALTGKGVRGDALRAGSDDLAGAEVVYRDGAWRPAPGGVHRAAFRFPPPLGRQPMQRYGSGEAITVPRHTRTARVTTLITASTWAPHEALVPMMPFLRPLAGRVRRTPLRRLLRLAAPSSGEASEARDENRRTASFVVAAVARGTDGSIGRGIVEGEDFYGLTAAALAAGANRLATTDGRAAGVLPPALAFDPADFLDDLAGRGLRWSRE
jgi:short subunit dehydrogenase-like uncharacterized protein